MMIISSAEHFPPCARLNGAVSRGKLRLKCPLLAHCWHRSHGQACDMSLRHYYTSTVVPIKSSKRKYAASLRQDDRPADEKSALERLRKFALKAEDELGITAAVRFGRAFCYGALVSLDYKMLGLNRLDTNTEEYKRLQSKVHQRSAKRLLHVCQLHAGVFSKFGQYVASLVRIVPDEYTSTLSALQDANPGVKLKHIERLFLEEFGLPISKLFRHFEPTPIAAASLAQCHKAITSDGQEVAVKVQYPRLERQTHWDIWTMRQLATLVGILFEEYEYTWLFDDFEQSIKLELDFLQEATNAERTAGLFQKNPRIHIPYVRWDLSTHRVLTMEYIKGVKVNNVAALKEEGINPVAVADTISGLFSHMVFSTGLVHCDPHPGNLLIRRPPAEKAKSWWHRSYRKVLEAFGVLPNFEVVLLDHGLYRRLNEDFRRSYCELWKAFMTRDEELGRRATAALGLDPQFFEVLSLISVNRTPSSTAGLGESMSDAEKIALREKYRDRTRYGPEQVRALLQGLPRDVLFVLRSNSLVRSLNGQLGQSVGIRFRIFGQSAVVGLSMTPQTDKLPPAYFLDEIRPYVQRLPSTVGEGYIIQHRRKEEILLYPEAPLNMSTAAEAFLFSHERRPLLKEIRRQIMVTDLRLRVWMVDKALELLLQWKYWSNRLQEMGEVGELMVDEELKPPELEDENRDVSQTTVQGG